MSKAWKDFEREVARTFNGVRRVRINYAEVGGDVIHPTLSIECKYGKQIPKKALLGKRCRFLDLAFGQAIRYDPTKEPVVCLKTPGMRGFISIQAYPQSPVVSHHQPTHQPVCSDHPASPQIACLIQHLRSYI